MGLCISGPSFAAVVVKALQSGDDFFHSSSLAWVADVVLIQGQKRIFILLDVGGYISHQGVEVLGPLYQADREDQLRLVFVSGLDGDCPLSEHIPGAES